MHPAAAAGAKAAGAAGGATSTAGKAGAFGASSRTQGAVALPVPGAGVPSGRRRGGRLERWVGALAALLGLVLLLILLPAVIVFLIVTAVAGGGGGPAKVPPGSGIPEVYVAVYQEAEAAFGVSWLLLASVHKQESDFSRDQSRGIHSGVNCAGAAGPMQFGIGAGNHGCGNAGNSWATYQHSYRKGSRPAMYPYRVTPHPSVYDDFDAVMAAGAYLRAAGAGKKLDQRAWRAAFAYNPASWYANQVLERARAWEAAIIDTPSGGAPPPGGTGKWGLARPTDGALVSPFGWRPSTGSFHEGVDLAAANGARIYASQTGRVRIRAWTGGYGDFVCVRHTSALTTCYAHLSSYSVRLGQTVRRGQVIGRAGCTGHCFGPHLHFEVRVMDQPQDPERYMRFG